MGESFCCLSLFKRPDVLGRLNALPGLKSLTMSAFSDWSWPRDADAVHEID